MSKLVMQKNKSQVEVPKGSTFILQNVPRVDTYWARKGPRQKLRPLLHERGLSWHQQQKQISNPFWKYLALFKVKFVFLLPFDKLKESTQQGRNLSPSHLNFYLQSRIVLFPLFLSCTSQQTKPCLCFYSGTKENQKQQLTLLPFLCFSVCPSWKIKGPLLRGLSTAKERQSKGRKKD